MTPRLLLQPPRSNSTTYVINKVSEAWDFVPKYVDWHQSRKNRETGKAPNTTGNRPVRELVPQRQLSTNLVPVMNPRILCGIVDTVWILLFLRNCPPVCFCQSTWFYTDSQMYRPFLPDGVLSVRRVVAVIYDCPLMYDT